MITIKDIKRFVLLRSGEVLDLNNFTIYATPVSDDGNVLDFLFRAVNPYDSDDEYEFYGLGIQAIADDVWDLVRVGWLVKYVRPAGLVGIRHNTIIDIDCLSFEHPLFETESHDFISKDNVLELYAPEYETVLEDDNPIRYNQVWKREEQ